MPKNRDDFSKEVVRILQERVGNRCSNPTCRCLTSGPHSMPNKATRIGVAAHITAAASGGPRYSPSLSNEQRSSIENGIWLCQNCSKLVDSDEVSYPVKRLEEWRFIAETNARNELETGHELNSDWSDDKQGTKCTWCNTFVKQGLTVCLGCQSEVVYGLTRQESMNYKNIGLLVGAGIAVLLFFLLPVKLNAWFLWNLQIGWGLGVYALIPVTVVGFVASHIFSEYQDKQKRLELPRFFRSTVT